MAGSILARTSHFVLHRAPLHASRADDPAQALFAVDDVWLGAMVPKRWARRAVTRNTIKRQVYTVSQDFESSLTRAAHVVRLRSGFDRQHFVSATSDALKAAVRSELQQLFARAAGEAAPLVGSRP